MTTLELCEKLHFDSAQKSYNPYFFEEEYEEKGVLVLMKVKDGSDLDYIDIEDLCFQCPRFEHHPDLVKMVLFLFDKDNTIYDYSIASSLYKITRHEILQYEQCIGMTID